MEEGIPQAPEPKKRPMASELTAEDIPVIKTDLPIPSLKTFSNKQQTDVRYTLIDPYVSVHIYWNNSLGEIVYEIEEPILTRQEKKVLERLEEGITELLNVNLILDKSEKSILTYLHKTAKLLIAELGIRISRESYSRVFYYLWRDFIGLNEIESLMKDFFIEDIECNGINSPVYIVHRTYRNLRTNLMYNEIDGLASFVEKLAQRSGRYISYANPILDGSLPDGSRVNATYTMDITSKGPTFTIRKFTRVPWTPTQLIALNTASAEMLAYFWMLLQYKMNLLIVGGTGSGKTTLLNALAFFIPPEARIVSIEDTKELNLPRENWLPSVARTGVGLKGEGDVDMFSLLKASFRQNPDYVIVGEVRGKEAFVLFQGMASGHPSISTLHADSVGAVVRRLQTPPISLPPTLMNSLDSIAIMAHSIVKNKETRRLREVDEIQQVTSDGKTTINVPFKWDPQKDIFYYSLNTVIFQKIMQRYGISQQQLLQEFKNRSRLLYEMYRRKIFEFTTVQKVINSYYKNPVQVLQQFGIA